MFRGEFICGNGLVIPNNITSVGIEEILKRAIQGVVTLNLHVALVSGVYAPDLQIEDLVEPTIGTNGYARIDLDQNAIDWPTMGEVNGEWFIESKDLVWTAVGGSFNQPITRMALVGSLAGTTGDVFALSGALPEERTIGTGTLEADRTFRYRLYSR